MACIGRDRMHHTTASCAETNRWLHSIWQVIMRYVCHAGAISKASSCRASRHLKESLGPCCPHICQLQPGQAYTMSRSRLRLESLSPSSLCRLLDLCGSHRLHRQQPNKQTSNSRRDALESYRTAGVRSSNAKREAARTHAFGEILY